MDNKAKLKATDGTGSGRATVAARRGRLVVNVEIESFRSAGIVEGSDKRTFSRSAEQEPNRLHHRVSPSRLPYYLSGIYFILFPSILPSDCSPPGPADVQVWHASKSGLCPESRLLSSH
jgi:hypothetical protein